MDEIEKNPLVSVIIPFYSGKIWLKEAIESVLNQEYSNLEIILINDGSKENLDDIIDKYTGFLNYVKTNNHGAASARNTGIKLSRGEYLAFLDSDDIWERNKLKNQIAYMESHKNIMWSITSYSVFDNKNNKIFKTVDCQKYNGIVFPKILNSSPIATPTVVIRRKIIDEIDEWFSESLIFGEDSYFWIKLSIISPIACIPQPLTKVRWRGTNAAGNIIGQIKARFLVYDELKKNNLFIENEYKINKLSLLLIKYCHFLYNNFIKSKKTSDFCLKILYFPAKILFKFLSLF